MDDRSDPDAGGAADDAAVDSCECTAQVAALADEMYTAPPGKAPACTAVVRLEHETRAIIGYQLFCRPYDFITEEQARARAESDTGLVAGTTFEAEEAFVFLDAPTPDQPGSAAAVSARVGLTVFGGTIGRADPGDIVYPASWRDPVDLGTECTYPAMAPLGAPGCPSGGGELPVDAGYDLAAGGAPLSAEDIEAATAVVQTTAIPSAFYWGGYLGFSAVLRYARAVDPFDPSTAEWIVIVSGGWLE